MHRCLEWPTLLLGLFLHLIGNIKAIVTAQLDCHVFVD